MAQRDLTFNTPQPESGASSPEINPAHDNNPFLNLDDELLFEATEYGKPHNHYQSNNGTSSNLLSGQSSMDDLRARDDNASLRQPEFDRYPSWTGNRLSTYSQNLAVPTSATRSEDDYLDGSVMSANPLAALTDFSPFGGYPALSFPLHIDEKEPDDYLHNPDPVADAAYEKNRFLHDLKSMDKRSAWSLVGLVVLTVGVLCLFVVYPVLTFVTDAKVVPETYEVLTNYKYPILSAIRTDLIDPDTPEDELYRETNKGDKWKLVFSDEFNVEGRTFFPDDDQFFEAVDIHYDATKDLEWYDPDAITTENGTLVITMDAYKNHDLFYRSGMLQSWNKLCFTQGMIMFSAQLPNYGNVSGLWPGLWTMANLVRPGYLATSDGVWPYSYEDCDAGITANQSSPDGISYLPGQKLNSCTCKGGDHPNIGTGRGGPEIDILEGAIDTTRKFGVASQSLQAAPMDIWYYTDYNFMAIEDPDITTINTYTGGPFQQAVSAITSLNTLWYEYGTKLGAYQEYGMEYLNDRDDGYITWYAGNPTWTLHSYSMAPNGNIGWRPLPQEPMAIVMNLGISNNWAYIDWPSIVFPSHLRVDYVRIYQPEDAINLSCDPEDYPTSDYIELHLNAYQNVNLTSWEKAGYSFPKNKLIHGCD